MCRLLAVGLTFIFAVSPLRSQVPDDNHVVMGMPSNAGAADKNDFLVKKKHYVVSYNNKAGTPNWVAWHLTKEYLGDEPRGPFVPDDDLPDGFKKVFPNDYKQSGFDRGHMCPHSDRNKTQPMSDETFFMTNMVPQSPENNQKAWNQLELYCRELVQKRHKECYIIAGPTGVGGQGRNSKRNFIGENKKVRVPSHTWKVVMVVPEGVKRPEDVKGDKTRLIAVMIPNDRSPTFDWGMHRVTVEEIESQTDLKFFDKVTDAKLLEKKDDIDQIPIGPPIPVDHSP